MASWNLICSVLKAQKDNGYQGHYEIDPNIYEVKNILYTGQNFNSKNPYFGTVSEIGGFFELLKI